MTLKHILDTEHLQLENNQKMIKSFYVNEFLRLDPTFDDIVRKAMLKSLKRGHVPAKRIGLENFSQEEILDITNIIE